MLLRTCLVAFSLMVLCAPALAEQVPQTDETAGMDGMAGMNRPAGQDVLANSPSPLMEEDIDAIIANSVPPPLTEPVRVRSGMLSVKLESALFGPTLQEIGRQAGFEAVITPEIAQKELSTTFRDMDLQKGLQRLLSLISHRNFFIYYGADDTITRIEIYGSGEVRKPDRRGQTYTPSTGPSRRQPKVRRPSSRTVTPASVQRPSVIQRKAPSSTSVQRVQPPVKAEPTEVSPETFVEDHDIPFIVPQQEPQYVPPYKRRR